MIMLPQLLQELHWFPISFCGKFHMWVLIYKAVYDLGPGYLIPACPSTEVHQGGLARHQKRGLLDGAPLMQLPPP